MHVPMGQPSRGIGGQHVHGGPSAVRIRSPHQCFDKAGDANANMVRRPLGRLFFQCRMWPCAGQVISFAAVNVAF